MKARHAAFETVITGPWRSFESRIRTLFATVATSTHSPGALHLLDFRHRGIAASYESLLAAAPSAGGAAAYRSRIAVMRSAESAGLSATAAARRKTCSD